MGANTPDSDELTGINITPLVDIVLVLLIIFMVSSRVVMSHRIEVETPTPLKGPAQAAQPPVMLTIDGTAQLFVDGVRLSRDAAMTRLRAAHREDHDVRVVISADKTLGYGQVVELIDLVRGQGITHFSVADL